MKPRAALERGRRPVLESGAMLGDIQTTALPNGCRVVTSAMPGVDSFSLCFDAGTGGRFERASEAGFSHFLEHMLFKGSAKRRTTRALSRPIERVGGQFNAFTSAERTCFYAIVPADAAALAADVLGDMFARPLFEPGEIDRERLVGLDRVLPKKRLLRGFGALLLGGMLGTGVSAFGLATKKNHAGMLFGSVLCAVFAGLLFRGYKRVES